MSDLLDCQLSPQNASKCIIDQIYKISFGGSTGTPSSYKSLPEVFTSSILFCYVQSGTIMIRKGGKQFTRLPYMHLPVLLMLEQNLVLNIMPLL